MGNKTPLNYPHLSAALNQVGPWAGKDVSVDRDWYIAEMKRRIKELDWERVKNDVAPFISSQENKTLVGWDADFFLLALQRLP
jgi:hypothetical protein